MRKTMCRLWRMIFAGVLISQTAVLPIEQAVFSPAAFAVSGLAPSAPTEIRGVPYYSELLANADFTDMRDHWARETVLVAAAHGFVRGYGERIFAPDQPVSRQEALLLVTSMAGWGKEVQDAKGTSGGSSGAKPNSNFVDPLDEWAKGALEVAGAKGVIDKEQAARLQWKQPVTREEMAVWTAKALQLAPRYDHAQQKVFNFADWRTMRAESVPWMEAALQKGLMRGEDKGNGQPVLRPKESLSRAEAASLAFNAIYLQPSGGSRTVFRASVAEVEPVEGVPGQRANQRIHLASADGGKLVLVAREAQDQDGGYGFIVWKDGLVGSPSMLQPADQVEVHTVRDSGTQPPEQRVFLVRVVSKGGEGVLEGTVLEVMPGDRRIVIRDTQGQLRLLSLTPDAKVLINGKDTPLTHLPTGTPVTMSLAAQKVAQIEAALPVAVPGALPGGEAVRWGRIRAIDGAALKVVDSAGTERLYGLAPGYEIRKGLEQVRLSELRPGDPVTLVFSDTQPGQVSRIEIPGYNRQVQGIYKGTLELVRAVTGEAILKDAARWSGGSWVNESDWLKIRLPNGLEASMDGRLIGTEKLFGQARGKRVIMSVKDDFGGKSATRLAVLSGGEETLNDRIDRIDWAVGNLTLKIDGSQIAFDKSTIILRDGRLIDPLDLNPGDPVYVASDVTRNGYRAALISVETTVAPSWNLVQGDIKEVGDGRVHLYFYSKYKDNQWSGFTTGTADTMELAFAPDSKIIDLRGVLPVTIPVKDFLTLGPTKIYDEAYVHAVLLNDRVLAMTLRYKGPSRTVPPPDRTTLARVNTVDAENKTITFDQVRDWSDLSSRWSPIPITLPLKLEKAMVIKGEQVVDFSAIKKGDTCLLIRDGNEFEGIVVFIQ